MCCKTRSAPGISSILLTLEQAAMAEGSLEFRSRFVELLTKHREVLFSKSQVPEMRRRKTAMLVEIARECKELLGVPMTVSQVQKKIVNMKWRIKAKIDALQSGNKLVAFKKYEQQLLDLWDIPLVYNIQGNKILTSVGGTSLDLDVDSLSSSEAGPSRRSASAAMPGSPEHRSMKNMLDDLENEMACDLSVTELQKYVLLKKVKLLEAQERKLKAEEQKAARHNSILATIERIALKRERLMDLQLEKANGRWAAEIVDCEPVLKDVNVNCDSMEEEIETKSIVC